VSEQARLATAPEWHATGVGDDLPEGGLRRIQVSGRAVCVGRVPDGWVAFDDTCTHEECSLADGDLVKTVVTCPCHFADFDIRTGAVLAPPATVPINVYPVRVQGNDLQVEF
jgi:nitrite reductase/ring-hydroxylating ferredoxin subunit